VVPALTLADGLVSSRETTVPNFHAATSGRLHACRLSRNPAQTVMSVGKSRRAGYHHGNLKEALLNAARSLIVEKGAHGFTLAEAARLAGVSPAAPYRHFKDRNEILGALAVDGFTRFATTLEEAWDDGKPDAVAAFTRVGRAYLVFARDDLSSYRAMFEAGIALEDAPGLRAASGRAFDVLRTSAAALLDTVPKAKRPPVDLMGFHIWALSHGTATLFAERSLGRGRVPISSDEVLESGVLVYLRGLGILPPV